jgi:predicted tellurium resistance membrane protein TerC
MVIFGATILMKLMERYPIIVVIGAALIGAVAGELLVTDPTVIDWIGANIAWMDMHLPLGLGEISWAQIVGAVLVVVAGKWLAARAEKHAKVVDLAAEEQQGK